MAEENILLNLAPIGKKKVQKTFSSAIDWSGALSCINVAIER